MYVVSVETAQEEESLRHKGYSTFAHEFGHLIGLHDPGEAQYWKGRSEMSGVGYWGTEDEIYTFNGIGYEYGKKVQRKGLSEVMGAGTEVLDFYFTNWVSFLEGAYPECKPWALE